MFANNKKKNITKDQNKSLLLFIVFMLQMTVVRCITVQLHFQRL